MRFADNIVALALTAALAAMALPGCGGSSTIGRSAVNMAKESQTGSGHQYTLGPQFESQLEQMISQEVEALGGKGNVPMELNQQVLLNINYFLNDARGFMTRGLSRGSKYIPMMKAIFRQKGLPEDLVYLALIESGFKTAAVSRAAAVGPWQFIAGTGRRYGLVINEWVDERLDPVKSTYAAADYLTALHDMFNSWPLAIAGYNSGEGKIINGIKNYGVSNFWDMSDVGSHLANETKLYVPSFLAASFIAKDPAAYGLQIETLPPDQWEEVVVPTAISLKEAASYCGSSAELLQELNPHLKKGATPPGETDFVLRLPVGATQQFTKAYDRSGKGRAVASVDKEPKMATAKAAPAKPVQYPTVPMAAGKPTLSTITHKVRSGDNLGLIAKRYGLPVEAIKKNNKLSSNALKVGQILQIKSDLPLTTPAPAASGRPLMVVETPGAPRRSTTTHTVAAGENLGIIAQKYKMSVRELVDINSLEGTTIRVGQSLKVTGQPEAAPAQEKKAPEARTHIVASGENIGVIAQKYGLTGKELMALNKMDSPNIRVGQKLNVGGKPPAKAPTPAPPPEKKAAPPAPEKKAPAAKTYIVASGDNIGSIAQKYGLTGKELMALNNLDSPNIRVGQELKVTGRPATPAPAASKPAAAGPTHTVAAGDTLYSIARKYNLTVDDLKKINKLESDSVRPGRVLKVK
jgi:membrane-bound lytic murein transglycosylase D